MPKHIELRSHDWLVRYLCFAVDQVNTRSYKLLEEPSKSLSHLKDAVGNMFLA